MVSASSAFPPLMRSSLTSSSFLDQRMRHSTLPPQHNFRLSGVRMGRQGRFRHLFVPSLSPLRPLLKPSCFCFSSSTVLTLSQLTRLPSLPPSLRYVDLFVCRVGTGDNARHDIDRQYPRTPKEIYELNRMMAGRMSDVFGSKGVKVVPSMGNNVRPSIYPSCPSIFELHGLN
jgi:hypothetical protein